MIIFIPKNSSILKYTHILLSDFPKILFTITITITIQMIQHQIMIQTAIVLFSGTLPKNLPSVKINWFDRYVNLFLHELTKKRSCVSFNTLFVFIYSFYLNKDDIRF